MFPVAEEELQDREAKIFSQQIVLGLFSGVRCSQKHIPLDGTRLWALGSPGSPPLWAAPRRSPASCRTFLTSSRKSLGLRFWQMLPATCAVNPSQRTGQQLTCSTREKTQCRIVQHFTAYSRSGQRSRLLTRGAGQRTWTAGKLPGFYDSLPELTTARNGPPASAGLKGGRGKVLDTSGVDRLPPPGLLHEIREGSCLMSEEAKRTERSRWCSKELANSDQ